MEEKDLLKLNKKELKDYINTNGFFFHIQCEQLKKDEIENILTDARRKNQTSTQKQIPIWENIVVFKWIASQNYAKGEKSRNGYKYEQNGWDFSAYNKNPIILWQHDSKYGWIGHAIEFWNDVEWNLCILFYVDTDTLEDRNKIQVQRGYVTAISTWAISLEIKFEDAETWELYEMEDAEDKFGWENVWRALMWMSDVLTLIVTKAQMAETSLVTIWSNEEAIALPNAISNHYTKYAEQYKTMKTDELNKETPNTEIKEDAKSKSKTISDCKKSCEDCISECEDCIEHCEEMGWEMADKKHIDTMKDCIAKCNDCIEALDWEDEQKMIDCCNECIDSCKKCIDSCKKFPEDDFCKRCVDKCEDCVECCEDVCNIEMTKQNNLETEETPNEAQTTETEESETPAEIAQENSETPVNANKVEVLKNEFAENAIIDLKAKIKENELLINKMSSNFKEFQDGILEVIWVIVNSNNSLVEDFDKMANALRSFTISKGISFVKQENKPKSDFTQLVEKIKKV